VRGGSALGRLAQGSVPGVGSAMNIGEGDAEYSVIRSKNIEVKQERQGRDPVSV